jgi:hypothetical protein
MTAPHLPFADRTAAQAGLCLRAEGYADLARQVAFAHQATRNLVAALEAEQEASTATAQADARLQRRIALQQLRRGPRP